MINLKNSCKLAVKKLNVRKGRTAISIVTASLLFGITGFLMISTQVFLGSIFKTYNLAMDGKVLLEVRGVPTEATDDISRYDGQLLRQESYKIKSELEKDPEQIAAEAEVEVEKMNRMSESERGEYIKNQFEKQSQEVYLGSVSVVDERALAQLKLVAPKHQDTIPVVVSANLASIQTGAPLDDFYAVQKSALNRVFTSENELNAEVKFEIIGLLPGNHSFYRYLDSEQSDINAFTMVEWNSFNPGAAQDFIVPYKYADKLHDSYELTTYSDDPLADNYRDAKPRLVEFSSFEAARKFAKEYTCLASFNEVCSKDESRVSATELFTNRFGVSKYQADLTRTFQMILGFFIFISVIILGLTFSKIFIDEKKTSAIFQAVGATKMDIFKVYFVYAMIISLIVAVLVQVLGYAGALALDFWQAEVSTAEMQRQLVGLYDQVKIGFVGFSTIGLLPSLAAIFGGLISFLLNYDKILARNIIDTLKED